MNDGDLIAIAKKVYGEHTHWSGIQLSRLRMLAEEITKASRPPLPDDETLALWRQHQEVFAFTRAVEKAHGIGKST